MSEQLIDIFLVSEKSLEREEILMPEEREKIASVQSLEEFKKLVDQLVDQEKSFYIKFYIVDDSVEKKVEYAIQKILSKYGKDELVPIVYTCVKELMINANKANIKAVVMEENKVDVSNEKEYLEALIKFKGELTEQNIPKYYKKLMEKDLYVTVSFFYSKDGFRVEVLNNRPIMPFEDRRVREKLKKAMSYDDLAQFYLEQGDELEGAGLGIALIVMLMKGAGLDPSLFRISGPGTNYVKARIEIPFTKDYIPIRYRGKK